MYIGDDWTSDRLEAVANFMYQMALELNIMDGYHKSYDPLRIEGHTAHSYVMSLDGGGRHHSFDDLDDLARQMKREFCEWFGIEHGGKYDHS